MKWVRRPYGLLAVLVLSVSPAFSAVEMPARSALEGVAWLGHSSFRIARGGSVIYLDPWRVGSEPKDADIVLITHPHFDHFDPADIAKVSKLGTVVVTVAECAQKLKGSIDSGRLKVVKPGDRLTLGAVRIEAVPAYNLNKPHHPKEKGWAGFVVEIGGVRIYHAGDTDAIPEMARIRADVALLPVSGTYVMTAEEAAAAARTLNPRVAVPMHYGSVVGTAADAERFRALCGGIIVEILEKGSPEEITVSAQVDKTKVRVGELLQLSIGIAGSLREAPKLQLSDFDGFRVVSTGQSQQLQIQGGRTRRTLVLTYALAAVEPGKRQIGSVVVELDGRRYETPPIGVEVAESKEEESLQMEGGMVL